MIGVDDPCRMDETWVRSDLYHYLLNIKLENCLVYSLKPLLQEVMGGILS